MCLERVPAPNPAEHSRCGCGHEHPVDRLPAIFQLGVSADVCGYSLDYIQPRGVLVFSNRSAPAGSLERVRRALRDPCRGATLSVPRPQATHRGILAQSSGRWLLKARPLLSCKRGWRCRSMQSPLGLGRRSPPLRRAHSRTDADCAGRTRRTLSMIQQDIRHVCLGSIQGRL